MAGRSRPSGSDGNSDGRAPSGPDADGMRARTPRSIGEAQDSISTVARAGRTREGQSRVAALYSRSGPLTNREVVERGVGLPRTPETIRHYADLAGVDMRGAPVEVIENSDDIAYLDMMGAIARTDVDGVQLGPAAFADEETLVRTLGHESVHVRQYQEGRIESVTGPLEDEAYEAEAGFVETWRSNHR